MRFIWLASLVILPALVTAQTNTGQQQAADAEQEARQLAKAGKWEAATEAYDRAIALKPDFAEAYKGRGVAHQRMEQPELAIQDFDKAIQLAPEDAEAYCDRGGSRAGLRQFELAIQDYDKAVQIKPDYGEAYFWRGTTKSHSGDRSGAEADWSQAESLGYKIRIRVGGETQAAKLIRQPRPVYPKKAKKKRISGHVLLSAIIGKDGTIHNLSVVSGDPLLAEAAVDAVKQWVYAPTLLDGRPVEVVTQIDLNFTLSQ